MSGRSPTPSFREGMGGNGPSGECEGMDSLSWPAPAGEGRTPRKFCCNIITSVQLILLRLVRLYLQIHTMILWPNITSLTFFVIY